MELVTPNFVHGFYQPAGKGGERKGGQVWWWSRLSPVPQMPQNATTYHKTPQDATKCHKPHKTRKNATKCNKTQQNATKLELYTDLVFLVGKPVGNSWYLPNQSDTGGKLGRYIWVLFFWGEPLFSSKGGSWPPFWGVQPPSFWGKKGFPPNLKQLNSYWRSTTSQKCRPTHFRVCRSLKVYSLK